MSQSHNKRKNAAGRARDRPQAMAGKQQERRSISVRYPAQMRTRADVSLASSDVVYAAVTRIANALATMPIHLWQGDKRLTSDPRDIMLSLRPNRMQSAYMFKQAMEINRLTEGRAYAVKRFDAEGRLWELVCLDPTRVTPMISDETGDVWYQILRTDGRAEYLHNWYVLSLYHASTNGLSGIRVLDVLKGPLQYSRDVDTFSLEALKSVNKAIVLEYPMTLGGENRVRSVHETLEIYRKEGGKVLALDAGVKAAMLGGNAIDPDALAVGRVTRSRVATVYNLPPHLLGDYTDASASTTEQQMLEFLTLTMNPDMQQWTEELDWKLLSPQERRDGLAFRFDVESYLRADGKTLSAIRQSQIRCGSRTVNEIRRADHKPPVPGGDVAFVSKDLAPVEMVAKGATIDLDALAGEHNSAKKTEEDEDA